MSNLELRKQLDNVLTLENEENWYIPDLFAQHTAPLLPPQLDIVAPPPEENQNYNCFIYVLGLSNNADIIRDTGGFIYSSFIEMLIEKGYLIQKQQPQQGDIVLYSESDGVGSYTHSGILESEDMIISKWAWGPTIRHRLLDIPLHWGGCVTYYEPIEEKQSIDLYNQFKKYNVTY